MILTLVSQFNFRHNSALNLFISYYYIFGIEPKVVVLFFSLKKIIVLDPKNSKTKAQGWIIFFITLIRVKILSILSIISITSPCNCSVTLLERCRLYNLNSLFMKCTLVKNVVRESRLNNLREIQYFNYQWIRSTFF